MPFYEYKVVPAPEKPAKVKGAKGPARFAAGLQDLMNELAAEGWEYHRADTLPCTERTGLMSRATVTHNILVFRRELVFDEPEEPRLTAREAEGRRQLVAERERKGVDL